MASFDPLGFLDESLTPGEDKATKEKETGLHTILSKTIETGPAFNPTDSTRQEVIVLNDDDSDDILLPKRKSRRILGKRPLLEEIALKKQRVDSTIKLGSLKIKEVEDRAFSTTDTKNQVITDAQPLNTYRNSSKAKGSKIPLTKRTSIKSKGSTSFHSLMKDFSKKLKGKGVNAESSLDKFFLEMAKLVSESYLLVHNEEPIHIKELKERVASLEEENENLKVKISESEPKAFESEREKNEAQVKLSSVLKELESKQKVLEESKSNLENYQLDLEKLKKELQEAKAFNNYLCKSLFNRKSLSKDQDQCLLQLKDIGSKLLESYSSDILVNSPCYLRLAESYKNVVCQIEYSVDYGYKMALEHVKALYPQQAFDFSQLHIRVKLENGKLAFHERPSAFAKADQVNLPISCPSELKSSLTEDLRFEAKKIFTEVEDLLIRYKANEEESLKLAASLPGFFKGSSSAPSSSTPMAPALATNTSSHVSPTTFNIIAPTSETHASETHASDLIKDVSSS